MKLMFRVECPKCLWGYGPSPNDVNQGFVEAKCQHCGNAFFFKITVNDVKVEVKQILPNDVPCHSASNDTQLVAPPVRTIKKPD